MQMKFGSKQISALTPREKPFEVRDTDLPGLLIRIQPSGVQTYYCEYRNKQNLKQRIKLGRLDHLTLPQARDEAKKALGQVAQGTDPAKDRKRARLITLKAFVDGDYGSFARANHKRGNETVERLLSIFDDFKDTRLDEITAWKVEKWINERKKAGIKGATVNRNIAMLKACISRAVEWKLVESHPLRSIKSQKVDNAGIVRYLSDEEQARLFSALDKRELRIIQSRHNGNVWRIQRGIETLPVLSERPFADYLKPMILLSLNLGLRQGELFRACWSDINFSNKTITIRGQISKSGKTRHIPLNQIALGTLLRWKGESTDLGLIFPGRTGDSFNNVKKSWTALLVDAKITAFRWHDMRHHFASSLVMKGVDLNTVRELLGHSDIKMTLRYAHLAPKVMAEAVARLDRIAPIERMNASEKLAD